MSLFNEKWEKDSHYDKANDKVYIDISTNTNTLMSEMIPKLTMRLVLGNINPLIVSYEL